MCKRMAAKDGDLRKALYLARKAVLAACERLCREGEGAAEGCGGGGGGGGGEGGGGGLKGGGGKPLCAGFSVEVVRVLTKGGKMDVAVDILELKDRVLEMAWEPHAARFAALTVSETVVKEEFPSDLPGGLQRMKTSVKTAYHLAFFTVADKPGGGITIAHAHTVDRPPSSPVASALLWSPRGEVVVLSNFATSSSGWLQFFDADRKRVLAEVAHDGASGMAWDPSGRLLATFKTRAIEGLHHVRESVTNGYKLWTFQGGRVHEADKPKLFQFLWRPRPAELLTDEEARGVAKNLRAYIQKHADEDKAKLQRRALLERLRKRRARDEFREFVRERLRDWEENVHIREDKGLLPWSGEVVDEVEEAVEVLVSEEAEAVQLSAAGAQPGSEWS
jgi:translation initiation factor 3 subunit B